MRAVICDGFDGPRIGEMPEPGVQPGHLLIDVHAASVSVMDCLMVSGKYQMKPASPFVPGTNAEGHRESDPSWSDPVPARRSGRSAQECYQLKMEWQ